MQKKFTVTSKAKKSVLTIVLMSGVLATAILHGQSSSAGQRREAFDVVSIRPTATPKFEGNRGAGGGGGQARNTRNPRADNPCSVIVEPQIDPKRFDATNATIIQLIGWAYDLPCVGDNGSYFIFDIPDWAKKDGFDVQATRTEDPSDYKTSTLSGTRAVQTPGPRIRRMLQTMLADRLGLTMHRESREMQVYVLDVAKGGPKYTASRPAALGQQLANGVAAAGGRGEGRTIDPEFSVWKEGDNLCCDAGGPVHIDGRRKPLSYVTDLLAYFLGRPILDRTKLSGEYNFFLNFAPIERAGLPPVRATEGPLPTKPIFEVLQQVGLELKQSREKVDVWVIDHVQRPTEN